MTIKLTEQLIRLLNTTYDQTKTINLDHWFEPIITYCPLKQPFAPFLHLLSECLISSIKLSTSVSIYKSISNYIYNSKPNRKFNFKKCPPIHKNQNLWFKISAVLFQKLSQLAVFFLVTPMELKTLIFLDSMVLGQF